MAGLISNGTYVLGNPDTRDLYIGDGLKQGTTVDGKHYIATDETVLWESESASIPGNTVTLSESYKNFEYVEIHWAWNRAVAFSKVDKFTTQNPNVGSMQASETNGAYYWGAVFGKFTDDTHFNFTYSRQANFGSTSWVAQTNNGGMWKIVGINRTAGGN